MRSHYLGKFEVTYCRQHSIYINILMNHRIVQKRLAVIVLKILKRVVNYIIYTCAKCRHPARTQARSRHVANCTFNERHDLDYSLVSDASSQFVDI